MFGHRSPQASSLRVKRVLNFNGAVTPLVETPLVYAGEKPGGSDVGHVVAVGDEKYIIKTGVSLSLLGQALKKFVDGKPEKERLYLSFIVGSFTRIASDKLDKHPEIASFLQERYPDIAEKKFADMLTDQLCGAIASFKETDAGKQVLEKLKAGAENLSIAEIYEIYHYMANQNAVVREVLGTAAYSDVLYGAMGQFFSNTYQEAAGVADSQLDEVAPTSRTPR